MSRIACEIIAALAAFLTTVFAGYRCWRFYRLVQRKLPASAAGAAAARPRAGFPAALPVVSGFAVGSIVLALCSFSIAAQDRFYTPGAALAVALSVLVGGMLIVAGDLVFAGLIVAGSYPWNDRDKMRRVEARALRWRWLLDLALETAAAVVVVSAGVRFSVIGVGPDHAYALGAWSAPLTVLWLVAATNVVKLLDGLEGAANVLLLVAAVAVFYVTLGVNERFLNAFSLVVAAATLASLRFNFFPARLPLRGSGTAFVGFLFAVLTVLARQKTVATLLLFLPLLVVLLLVGGAMLAFLERTVSVGEDPKE